MAWAARRHWRLGALAAAAGVLLTALAATGQIGGGNRGIAPVNSSNDLLTTGIKVDVIAASANAARADGWRKAQREGWQQLSQRINGRPGPALPDGVLDSIVSAVVVEQEAIGPRRYVATLGILFDRVRAGQILGISGQVLRSPPLLVIPVQSIGGLPQVFEQRSEWQRAWAEFRVADSAVDYVRTSGTGADPLLLNAAQTGRRGRLWWREILDQYGAADVLIPIARLEYAYPGGPVTGRFSARFGPDNRLIDSFTLTAESSAAIPAMMDRAVVRMDQIYTSALSSGVLRADTSLILRQPVAAADLGELPPAPVADMNAAPQTTAAPAERDDSVAPPAPAGAALFTIQYASPDVASVSATERAVASISGVESAATNSLALGGTSVMQVSYRGDLAALRRALAARGFTVQEGGGGLRISR